MQMNKAILRNSKIVIFKNFRGHPGDFFSQPAGSETDLFSRRPGFFFKKVIDNMKY